jgi:hypothetical protein
MLADQPLADVPYTIMDLLGREHRQTAARSGQCFRGFSPVFAGLRGSLTNRGDW